MAYNPEPVVWSIESFVPKLVGDLYPELRDVPGADWMYRAFAGKQPAAQPAPIDTLIGSSLDPARFGQ